MYTSHSLLLFPKLSFLFVFVFGTPPSLSEMFKRAHQTRMCSLLLSIIYINWDLYSHPISTLFIENYHNSESVTIYSVWKVPLEM